MPVKAQVGDRRNRKGGVYEKQPSGKWKRVTQQGAGAKPKAPTTSRRSTARKPASKRKTSKWAKKDPVESVIGGLSAERRRAVLLRALGESPGQAPVAPSRPKAAPVSKAPARKKKPAKKKPAPPVEKTEQKKPEEKSLRERVVRKKTPRKKAPVRKPPQKQDEVEKRAEDRKPTERRVEAEKPQAKKEEPKVEKPKAESAESSSAPLERNKAKFDKFRVDGVDKGSSTRSKSADKMARDLFGRDVSDDELRDLIGSPKGSDLYVKAGNGMLIIEAEVGNNYVASRIVRKVGDDLVMDNDLFQLNGQEKGTGTMMFAQQVNAASKMGVSRIEVSDAAGYGSAYAEDTGRPKTKWNGYYTWGRLGYDGEVSLGETQRKKLGFNIEDTVTMKDIMLKPGGAKLWREYGSSWSGSFDLKEGSYSRRVLDAYLEEIEKR